MSNERDREFAMRIAIAAAREDVWRALTEARELERWFPQTAVTEPHPGGQMMWQWGDLHTWRSTIEVFEPGQHLRLCYDSAVDDGRGGKRPLWVDFFLEGERGTTTLRLVHSGFGPEADFDSEYDGIAGGWPVELGSLRLYLERHRGRDRQLATAVRRTEVAADVMWRRLIGADGLQAPVLAQHRGGERFRVAVDGAGAIEGTVLFVPTPREFSGVAENLGHGWLRVHCESWGGATNVWLWLALYGAPDDRVRVFRRGFERLLDRIMGRAGAAGGSDA